MKEEIAQLIREVQEVFPCAECQGYNAKDGYCIYWPTGMAPVIATGHHPKQAWKKAHKLIKGKNKKALEKLRRSLLGQEAKKGIYGPGA